MELIRGMMLLFSRLFRVARYQVLMENFMIRPYCVEFHIRQGKLCATVLSSVADEKEHLMGNCLAFSLLCGNHGFPEESNSFLTLLT